nr:hypothetical protein [Tanacetum cinerariifolium]
MIVVDSQINNKDVLVDGKKHDDNIQNPPVENSALQNVSTSSHDADIPNLEDISHDADDVGAEADINNMESTISVSPIPTSRIHKDHLTSQIIGDLSSTTQTRSMAKAIKDQGGLSQMFNEDFHTCMFACFLSQEEPKRVHQALKDPSWIEAMQEELLQFKQQKVWILVDLPYGKRAIGTKWVYRNKKDERVARIEAIRLFLAYASFMGFLVYQMDVKTAFLYGTIKEEVYVCQPPVFKDPEYPDKVYKVVKALYGLHQAPRAWLKVVEKLEIRCNTRVAAHLRHPIPKQVYNKESPSSIGMKYDEILPIFQAKFDANMRFLFKSRKEMEEEDEEIIKSINETPAQKAAKRRKVGPEKSKGKIVIYFSENYRLLQYLPLKEISS